MDLNRILEKTVEQGASDLHICTGLPPVVRVRGDLLFIDDTALTAQDCYLLVQQCINSEKYEELERKGQVDSSYAISGLGRFRVNIFKQRGSLALALRTIPTEIPEISELGLPGIVYDLADRKRGLVLITGPTGSGKSTTLASMIHYINQRKKCHIVTIEDPIEFLHKHDQSVIIQREVGVDTNGFAAALRAVLREDPDVILVGEMRDKETIETALTAAETGHLVFSTLHTLGAAKTIDRIIDVFPSHQQQQVKSQLSTVLQGIVSQQLLLGADGKKRVAATEIMTWTPAIANLIREARTPQINSNIHTGMQYGMHSMDSSIAKLFMNKEIDFDTASQYAMDCDNFKKLLIY